MLNDSEQRPGNAGATGGATKGTTPAQRRCNGGETLSPYPNGVAPALMGGVNALRPTTAIILVNLSFLFAPAGVGVIGNCAVLYQDGIALLVILTLSTVFWMLAVERTFIGVCHVTERWMT